MMKRFLSGVVLAAACASAHAQITAGTEVVCVGAVATLRINALIGSDARKPGMLWIGIAAPDRSAGMYLDLSGNWQSYTGGLIPPAGRYDAGLPVLINADIPLPGKPHSTAAFADWDIGLGEGVYTDQAKQLVAQRRAQLDGVKPKRVASGTWDPMLDDDNQYIWSLVASDMLSNQKYRRLASIQNLDCGMSGFFGGGGH
ncbi:hypothetical protein [Burkholderia vietnamiensis]|uniref:hypothetical protein n=1 Tax=Burkholderia vietnamiensis TaxID=60552 RepID=UPI001CF41621|nr:hypothetical protein [Burkholderia vietnamiensis]MCA8270365.1 hypothetical protein [Burkholderia vietnamiensis]